MVKILKVIAKVALGLLLLYGALLLVFFESDLSREELLGLYGLAGSETVMIQGMPVHLCDEGTGEPIILLHGTGASLHTWTAWAEALADEYRVIRVDLPGFGLTGPHPDADYSVQAYVAFVKALAAHLELHRFHLAGNSLGGFIAWNYAATHPEQVDQLILIDPSGVVHDKPSPLVFRLARQPVLRPALRWATPKFLVRSSLEDVYADKSLVSEELVQRYFDMSLGEGNRQAFIDRAQVPKVDRTDMLRKITAPSLILWGAKDDWIPLSDATVYEQEIPNAQVIVFDDAGHVPMEEVPVKSVLAAKAFLQAD